MDGSTEREPAALDSRLVVGVVGRPHGLDGSFHVRTPRGELPEVGGIVSVEDRELRVVRRAGTMERPILRLEGHDGRDAADALRGAELSIEIEAAPTLGEQEWWARDLIGCLVADGERPVGDVRALLALPSCEALEVLRSDGSALLVPLVSDAVREVDVEGRRIDIDLRFLGEE
ncbi:MAG TPA: ribosome maturation factor RimM [Solirubrobacteraceae bacterium]|nr:ribosome maturation factor RimM [Solirubrobacteraceae bacterium]